MFLKYISFIYIYIYTLKKWKKKKKNVGSKDVVKIISLLQSILEVLISLFPSYFLYLFHKIVKYQRHMNWDGAFSLGSFLVYLRGISEKELLHNML
jgi:hypothetical protein